MSKQPPLTASTVGPCPTLTQISRTPRHCKFTQHHCTTRSPPINEVSSVRDKFKLGPFISEDAGTLTKTEKLIVSNPHPLWNRILFANPDVEGCAPWHYHVIATGGHFEMGKQTITRQNWSTWNNFLSCYRRKTDMRGMRLF